MATSAPKNKPKKPSLKRSIDRLFTAVSSRSIGKSVCFFCGTKLTKTNRSDEHVIPTWLQSRFDLWDQQIILLNGTVIPYRQLTIPCCKICNTTYLSHIENAVKTTLDGGAPALRAMNQIDLFVWLSKIMYGLLYREHLLDFDRKKPLKGRLVRRTFLQRIHTLFLFMQAARVQVEFADFSPASIFVFDTQVPIDKRVQFDFTDSPLFLTVACRLGSVGIIAVLLDGGTHKALFEKSLARFYNIPLHPLQFRELTARVFYKASLFNRNPKYITVESKGGLLVHMMPIQGLSTKPIYDVWDMERYAKLLSHHTGHSIEQLFVPPDKVWTFLEDSSGNPVTWDVGEDNSEIRPRSEIQELLAKMVRRPFSSG